MSDSTAPREPPEAPTQQWLPRRFLWRGGAFGLGIDAAVRIRDLADVNPAPATPGLPPSERRMSLPPAEPGPVPAVEEPGSPVRKVEDGR